MLNTSSGVVLKVSKINENNLKQYRSFKRGFERT